MTSELQQTRYDRLVRRVGGIIGTGSKVAEALGELFPTLDVENVPSELLALMTTQTAWGSVNRAAVAGQNSRTQLFNPVDSGKLITCTSVGIHTGGDGLVVAGLQAAALVNVGTLARFRDTRFPFTNIVTGELRDDTQVGATPATIQIRSRFLDTIFLNDPNDICVLAPGSGLVVSATVANTALITTFFWREREAEASELNF